MRTRKSRLADKNQKNSLVCGEGQTRARACHLRIEFEGIQPPKFVSEEILTTVVKKNKEEQKRKGDVLGGQGDQRGQLVSYVVSRW